MAFNPPVLTEAQNIAMGELTLRVWHVTIKKEWPFPEMREIYAPLLSGEVGLPLYVPGSESLVGHVIGPVWCVTVDGDAVRSMVLVREVRPQQKIRGIVVDPGRVEGVTYGEFQVRLDVTGLKVNGLPPGASEPEPQPIVVGG